MFRGAGSPISDTACICWDLLVFSLARDSEESCVQGAGWHRSVSLSQLHLFKTYQPILVTFRLLIHINMWDIYPAHLCFMICRFRERLLQDIWKERKEKSSDKSWSQASAVTLVSNHPDRWRWDA